MEKQLHLVLGHWRPPSAHRGKHLGSIHRCMFADGFRQHICDDLKEGGKEETVHKVQKSLFNSAVSNIVYSAPAVQRKEQQSASTRITMFSVLTMQIVLLVTSMTLSFSWEVFLG